MYSALVRCYSQKEKNTTRACEDTEKGNEKIQTDGQEKGRNFSWSKTGKKGKGDKEEEGSREEGYTFLWVQNTLSFNKGTYILLCVI